MQCQCSRRGDESVHPPVELSHQSPAYKKISRDPTSAGKSVAKQGRREKALTTRRKGVTLVSSYDKAVSLLE